MNNVKQKEITVQISTGGYREKHVSALRIEQALKPFLDKVPVKKVILGWSLDQEQYQRTIEFLKPYGTQCFLWLPVFSETGILKPVVRLIDDCSQEVKSYGMTEGENFEFYCPRQEINRKNFLEIYEENYSDIPFDGVFLDKIRYGAFSNGLGGVFSCFCPSCTKGYKAYGIDVQVLKDEMKKVRQGTDGYGEIPLGIQAYHDGTYTFANPVWSRFFEKKSADIAISLKGITDSFHRRGMQVGMDTFAPFLSYFAGQDTGLLSGIADFIKPMMYRITQAPAGLPFEAGCLIEETIAGNREEAASRFYEVIGCSQPENGRFSLDFVCRELEELAKLGVPIHAGIEVNANQAAPSNPAYIRENLKGMDALPIDGYVLSWDFLSAPQENLQTVTDYFDK